MEGIQIISNYERLCHSVTELIDASGYKLDFVSSKLGFSRLGFYRKRKRGNFKPAELKKLFDVIDNGSLDDKLLLKILEKHKDEPVASSKETNDFFNSID